MNSSRSDLSVAYCRNIRSIRTCDVTQRESLLMFPALYGAGDVSARVRARQKCKADNSPEAFCSNVVWQSVSALGTKCTGIMSPHFIIMLNLKILCHSGDVRVCGFCCRHMLKDYFLVWINMRTWTVNRVRNPFRDTIVISPTMVVNGGHELFRSILPNIFILFS